ncbi:MAG: MmcQ/YjbR family DNA-binding protein [Duncaniella sp.]|nr:MmcQ/YjbR family DNA-binding protein [Duncaniella sp.]
MDRASIPHAHHFYRWRKWFCLFDPDKKFIDIKCSPEIIAEMQARYSGAFPAWHMNKEHWLGIEIESDMPDSQIKSLIADGYKLVAKSLPAKTRAELGI